MAETVIDTPASRTLAADQKSIKSQLAYLSGLTAFKAYLEKEADEARKRVEEYYAELNK